MTAIGRGLFVLGLLVLGGQVFGQANTFRSDSAGLRQPTRLTDVDVLTDAELDERLNSLLQQVQHNEKAASTWWNTWVGLYAGATVGQGVAACLSPNKSTRQDMVLGAGTTLLGMVGQFISPVKSGYNPGLFDQGADLDRTGRLEQLSQAEALLAIQAEKARSGKNWQTHALSGSVNLASGLITWLGFKRSFLEGVANFALNTAITEIQIYSQPTRAIKDYAECVSTHQRAISVQTFAMPGGVCLVMNF